MRYTQLISTATAILLLAGCHATSQEIWGEKIIACGDNTVLIIDASESTPDSAAVIWQWKIQDALDELPRAYQDRNRSIDDCKCVDGGRKLLITSSSSSTILLDIATRKCLFWAHTPMAHSAEYLPGGRIAVANSTNALGNSLELYDERYPEKVLFRDSLYFGHGSVWMEKEQRLYALGYQELRAYSLKDWETESPRLQLEKTFEVPTGGGHDLSRISEEEMLITTHDDIYVFNTKDASFTPFQGLQEKKNIKSVNYSPLTGQIIYTRAEIDWWTHHLYSINPDWTLTINQVNLYKVRPLAQLP